MRLGKPLGIAIAAFLLLFPACKSLPPGNVPAGFAAYPDQDTVKGVSPEGIVYRIRYVENKPAADLPFWKEALKKRMLDAGYKFLSESDAVINQHPAYLLELTAPVGNTDYIYLTAIYLDDDDRIAVIESAGEVVEFNKRRASILEAMEGIEGGD